MEQMQQVLLTAPDGHTAAITLHGAHVTAWRSPSGEDLIFLSKKAVFAPPKAIRGGVPICFPQFGMAGPMKAQHGFARNVAWEVESQTDSSATLLLRYDGSSQPEFPHPFELRTTVALDGKALTQELAVKNTGDTEMGFTTALHTYLHVAGIDGVRVEGLSQHSYLDNLQAQARCTEGGDALAFSGEVDRIYLDVKGPIKVVDSQAGRTFTLSLVNFPDAVVWNPWVAKAKSMADFGDEEYKEMVCVESAVGEASKRVVLQPAASWSAHNVISYS